MKPDKKKKPEVKKVLKSGDGDDDDGWKLSRILLEDRRKRLGYVEEESRPIITIGQPEVPANTSQPAKPLETYSVAEAAAILKVTTATIYRLIQRGKLRYLKSLRHKRIPKVELERFMKQDLG